MRGGEPYPNPNLNTLTFVLQLLRVNFCTEIFVKLLYAWVVLCCVARSYLVIKQIEGTCLFHCLSNIHRHYTKLYVLYI